MFKLAKWAKLGISLVIIASVVFFIPAYIVSAAGPLGTAADFAVLGASTVTNTGSSVISAGDVGVSPGTAITGFPPGIVNAPGTIHSADAAATQAQVDALDAYNQLAGMTATQDLTGQDLGGLTLTPGVYHFSSSAELTGTLTLNAQNDPTAMFVFQIGSTLTTASNSSVVVINPPKNDDGTIKPWCDKYWQVGSSATLGTGTEFVGTIIAHDSITMNTGATLSGRAIALNAAVTLDTNSVTVPVCTLTPPPPPLPELPAVILLGLGLAGLASFSIIKKRNARAGTRI